MGWGAPYTQCSLVDADKKKVHRDGLSLNEGVSTERVKENVLR